MNLLGVGCGLPLRNVIPRLFLRNEGVPAMKDCLG